MIKFILIAVVLAVVLLVLWGDWQFQNSVSSEIQLFLKEKSQPLSTEDINAKIKMLPAPVQKYLRLTLGENPVPIQFLKVTQGGRFRLKPDQNWMPMEAVEYVRIDRPGYLWHSKVNMMPLVSFSVRDYYWNGKAEVFAKILSLITAAKDNSKETELGALIRWVVESPWFPHAFLSPAMKWQAISASEVQLLVEDHGHFARFKVFFDQDGWIQKIETEDRPFEENGQYARRKYSGYYTDWREVNGMKLPFGGGAIWHLSEGEFHYVEVIQKEYVFNPEE